MILLQRQVGAWHRATFPGCTDAGRLAKLHEEVAELAAAPADPAEMADVLIVLLSIAEAHGVDLIRAAQKKFAIVRARDQRARDIERRIPT